jgi:chloride channel protein, CIC family
LSKREKYYVAFIKWLQRNVGPYQAIITLSVLTGIVTGISAIVLKSLIHYVEAYGVSKFPPYLLFLTPMAGIMIVTLLHKKIFKRSAEFHGVGDIINTISRRSAIMNFSLTYAKLITSAVTVGFGGSSGLESPIVVTGSAIGSNIARLFRLEINYRILLIGCGASAGIAAIFNAPIAGVVFAMEVIMPKLTATYFIPVLLSAASGSLLSEIFSSESLFAIADFKWQNGIDQVPYFIIVGIFGGIVSLYFTRLSWSLKTNFSQIKNDYFRALLGGSLLGMLVFLFPRLYGEGYVGIYSLFKEDGAELFPPFFKELNNNETYALPLIFFALMLLKPIAANITLNSGGDGGQFAPSFITGGYMGYTLFLIFERIMPGFDMPVTVFVLLGMSAVLSGVMHAPLTGIFLIAEITGGYSLLVPLMLVAAISFFTKFYFEKKPIHYHKDETPVPQQQHEWAVLSRLDLMRMTDNDYHIFSPEQTLPEMVSVLAKSKRNFFPVVDEKRVLQGIITLDDFRPLMFEVEKNHKTKAKDLMHMPTTFIDSNEQLLSALEKFDKSNYWNLPVQKDGKFVGFISKSTLLDKMRKELDRSNDLF